MTRTGHPRWALIAGAAAGLGALASSAIMWGFTVDDALISVQVAREIATGHGWRFDPQGPIVDAVTPLPWPILIAPLGRLPPLVALRVLAAIGLALWVATASAVGARLGRAGAGRLAVASAAAIGACLPLAAHAVSGMETALATALATFAALSIARPLRAATLAGLAATLRPELAPWAIAIGMGAGWVAREGPQHERALAGLASAGLALAPAVVVAVARAVAFGSAVPLSARAKPSDLAHGLAYVGAALVVSGAPALLVAPRALARSPRALALAIAFGVHALAVAAAGGDWMPYARLLVPVLPSAWVVVAELWGASGPRALGARAAIAAAVGAAFFAKAGPAGRAVAADRGALVAAAGPVLADARAIASVDVGWLAAAAPPTARLVDLAGVTDPEIAALPGGHTSKRVDATILLDRGVDVVLVWAPRGEAEGPGRVVEARLVASELFRRRYEARSFLPLGAAGGGYVVYRRRPPEP